jgi:heptosyltransferase I
VKNTRVQRLAFAATSRLTDVAPAFGGRLLDAAIRPVLGSLALAALLARRNWRIMRRVASLRRFLVIPDIHIGDAVMTQAAVTALRDYFPDAEIDYVVNRAVAPVIEGLPEASHVIPLFTGGAFPSAADVAALRTTIRAGRYDLCLSFGTFVNRADLVDPEQAFVSFLTHAATLVRNEGSPEPVNHFSFQHYQFVRGVLDTVARPVRGNAYQGVRTTLADEAVDEASRFAAEAGLTPGAPVIMFNADGACRFNLLPFGDLTELVAQVAERTAPDVAFLVGAGHTLAGVGQRLIESVPASHRSRFRLVPATLSLAGYVALIDLADVFVTGDTGPLHLAAARATRAPAPAGSATERPCCRCSALRCRGCRAMTRRSRDTWRRTRMPRPGAMRRRAAAGTSPASTSTSKRAARSAASNGWMSRVWRTGSPPT